MAALIHHVRTSEVTPSETIVFLHTGGFPAIFTETFVEAFASKRVDPTP
jgi:1-aminocyclopropane-1-carboxylate deaminase/D-cysteine desulfhydrase-like pyridoxal-dependent ACC family enzyme